jgi:hypothetical protein
MTTIQTKEIVQTMSVGKDELTDLLTGALVGADKSKSAISRLGSVYLSYKGGELAVKSTDRYALVVGRLHIGSDHTLDELQILVGDVKRILALMKEDKRKDSPITLARIGDILTVHNTNSSITIHLMGETFPDVSHVFRESSPIESLSLSATRLGAFAKVPTSSTDTQLFLDFTTTTVGGVNAPSAIKIKVPHDTITWECALMPMRDRRN